MTTLKDFMTEYEIEDEESAKNALEDGAFLAQTGLSQDEVENLHRSATLALLGNKRF